ncbi:MAG: carboxypeptidase-like regulatory domain-containing protein [Desulfarculaceae bacterium]|nr:carboxypeptidase-like regulatory domain-containing protein [Desulfarculaceae bacterium]
MPRAILLALLLMLLALGLAGSGLAQSPPGPGGTGLDDLKYRAVYGRPPPPPDAQPKTGSGSTSTDKEGKDAEQEQPKPQYRWGNDPLLSPQAGGAAPPATATPGSPAPAASGAQPGTAPARPGAALPGASGYATSLPSEEPGDLPGTQSGDGGDGPPPPRPSTAPGSAPSRLIEVQVINGSGVPIANARVSVSSGVSGRPMGGYTNDLGLYRLRVPCFQAGTQRGLVYRVQVVSGMDMGSQLVENDRYNCNRSVRVSLVLEEGQRERAIRNEYRRRQFLYQQEDIQDAPKGQEPE